jgi:hypothetical protein
VFAALGYPDAAERQTELRLAHALNQVLEKRHLTQAAAELLGNPSELGLEQLGAPPRRGPRPRPAQARRHATEGVAPEPARSEA